MANTKSAKKRARQTPVKTARNSEVKSQVKTALRGAREAATGTTKEGPVLLKLAISKLQKAANKGVIKQKNASRKISRLMKMVAKAAATAKIVETEGSTTKTKAGSKAKKAPAKKAAARSSAKK